MSWAAGDEMIVSALARYHTLTSGQIARLTGRGPHLIRRRYRVSLGPSGIVKRLASSSTETAAYVLGDEGRRLVAEERCIAVEDLNIPPARSAKGLFFAHHTQTRDVLVSLALACGDGFPLACREVIGEWILECPREFRDKDKRFRIYRGFPGGVKCRPDGVVLVSPRDSELVVALAVEADRGTESMRAIRGKLEGYWQLWLRHFKNATEDRYLGAQALRVLFVLGNTGAGKGNAPPVRIGSMIRELAGFTRTHGNDPAAQAALVAFRRCFLFARAEELDEHTVLGDIWWNSAGERTALYRPLPMKEAA